MSSAKHEVIHLEPSGSAPSQARRVVRRAVSPTVSDDVTQTAELLVSELVTNAITHGTGTVTLSIVLEDDSLSVTVSDDEPSVPELQPECLMALGGRGLRMIESLASAWGVTPREDGPGKDVWFRLPVIGSPPRVAAPRRHLLACRRHIALGRRAVRAWRLRDCR